MKEYFAALPSREFVKEAQGYIANWNSMINAGNQGIASVWFRNLRYYFSSIIEGAGDNSGLSFAGEEGELIKMLIPQARSLNQQFLSICTKQKLNFEPLAEATDSKTLAATRLCSGLVQQILRDQKLDMKAYKMAEMATLTGFGYLAPWWDFMKGRPIGVKENEDILYSGNLNVKHFLPTQVIFDHTKEDFYETHWCVVVDIENRYDLMRKYPRLKDEIAKLPSVMQYQDNILFYNINYSDDFVFVNYLFHKSTPALENGRMAIFSTEDTVYYDELDNPYKTDDGAYIPVIQMKPEPVTATGFGYPIFSNILPAQEMMDFAISAVASNNAANAVQSILNPSQNDLSVKNIGNLRFMNYTPSNIPGGGKPEALQLTQSSPETYKFIDLMLSNMQSMYNINAAMRGNPPAGVVSGTAIATLTTNGIEFAQNFIKSYIDAVETCLTMCLYAYKNFADEPTITSMVGPNKTTMVKEFVGQDLAPVKRIIAKVSNPLMATAAGRLEVANQLMSQQLIQDPQSYFDVLEGAPESIMYSGIEDEQSLIQKENDDLREGLLVQALFFDSHDKHIMSHKSLTYDTEIRRNGEMLAQILAHIDEHEMLKAQQAGGMPQAPQEPGVTPDQDGVQMPQAGQEQGAPPAEAAQPEVDITQMPLQGPSVGTGV